MPAGGGGAGSGRHCLPPAWAPAAPRLLPPPASAPVRPRIAPGPASDSAPPPPVPSSPGRSPGPLPRHEEAVGEEAFPGEGSGGGWRWEGAGRAGRPEGRAGHHGWTRGRGLWSRARPTPAAVAASQARCRGLPICDLSAQLPPHPSLRGRADPPHRPQFLRPPGEVPAQAWVWSSHWLLGHLASFPLASGHPGPRPPPGFPHLPTLEPSIFRSS